MGLIIIIFVTMKNKNIKYSTAKRGSFKGTLAPKGYTHLIVKVQSKRTQRVYEAWQIIPTGLTIDRERFFRDQLIASIFAEYNDVKEEYKKERGNWLKRLLRWLKLIK